MLRPLFSKAELVAYLIIKLPISGISFLSVSSYAPFLTKSYKHFLTEGSNSSETAPLSLVNASIRIELSLKSGSVATALSATAQNLLTKSLKLVYSILCTAGMMLSESWLLTLISCNLFTIPSFNLRPSSNVRVLASAPPNSFS